MTFQTRLKTRAGTDPIPDTDSRLKIQKPLKPSMEPKPGEKKNKRWDPNNVEKTHRISDLVANLKD